MDTYSGHLSHYGIVVLFLLSKKSITVLKDRRDLLKMILGVQLPYRTKSFADVSIHHGQSGNFLNIQLKIDIIRMDSFHPVCGIKAAAHSKPDLEGIGSKL